MGAEPRRTHTTGPGSVAALGYVGGRGGAAAIQYDGSAGGGKLLYLGFPFETITTAAVRDAYMAAILRFFSRPARLESLTWLPDNRPHLVLSGEPGLVYSLQTSTNLADWATTATLTNTTGTFEWTDSISAAGRRFYRTSLAF